MAKKKCHKYECTFCKADMMKIKTVVAEFFYEYGDERKGIDRIAFCDATCLKNFVQKVVDIIIMNQDTQIMKNWVAERYLADGGGTPAIKAKCKAALQ